MDGDNSLGTITESIANIQMVNNTQQQATNDAITQLEAQTQMMMQAMQAMQIQGANMATPWTLPPIQQETYQNWQQPVANEAFQPQVPPPPTYNTSYGMPLQQGWRGGRIGHGRG